MAMKLYVYSHAVNVYILRYLGMPVEQFCELYGFNQGTVASWVTRERSVETLPASFIYALSLASSRSMGEIYEELLKLQEDYTSYCERVGFKKGKKVKKRLD
ncbi:TPA: type III secretion system protein PrgN [Enterococcus faecium]